LTSNSRLINRSISFILSPDRLAQIGRKVVSWQGAVATLGRSRESAASLPKSGQFGNINTR
jgi:hypothetical protein